MRKDLVMAGRLADLQLADVLLLVGWSEQPTVVELDEADGARVGAIYLHAGYVIGAMCGELNGRDAFCAMFADRADAFCVRRLTMLDRIPRPVGSLAGLLMEVLHGVTTLTAAVPIGPAS
jgi:hypothetical protein